MVEGEGIRRFCLVIVCRDISQEITTTIMPYFQNLVKLYTYTTQPIYHVFEVCVCVCVHVCFCVYVFMLFICLQDYEFTSNSGVSEKKICLYCKRCSSF